MKLSNSHSRSFLSISLALLISSLSQFAYSNELVIDEVIVTAEKRVESLQDVSKAVTALSNDEIERKNIVDFVLCLLGNMGLPSNAENVFLLEGIYCAPK